MIKYLWRRNHAQLANCGIVDIKTTAENHDDYLDSLIVDLASFLYESHLLPRLTKAQRKKMEVYRHLCKAYLRNSKMVGWVESDGITCSVYRGLCHMFWFERAYTICFDSGVRFYMHKNRIEVSHHGLTNIEKMMLSGDIELNPGPGMSKMKSSDLAENKKQLEKAAHRAKKKVAKIQAQIQRVQEHQKDRVKQERRKAADQKAYAEGMFNFLPNTVLSKSLMESMENALKQVAEAADSLKSYLNVFKEVDVCALIISLISAIAGFMSGSALITSLNVLNLMKIVGLDAGVAQSWFSKSDSSSEATDPTAVPSTSDAATCEKPVANGLLDDLLHGKEYVANGVKNAATYVTEKASSIGDATSEVFGQLRENLVSLFSFICNFFSSLCGKIPTAAGAAATLALIGRAALGWKSILAAVQWLWKHLLDIFYNVVYGMTPEEVEFSTKYPEVEQLYAACKLAKEIPDTVIDGSTAVCQQILGLAGKLEQMVQLAFKLRDDRFYRFLNTLLRGIHPIIERARRSPAMVSFVRTEPYAVYLYGRPGVGKSTLLDVLKTDIYKKLMDEDKKPESMDAIKFTRLSANEYWEGYTGQPVVVMDDFGCVKDKDTAPNEDYLTAIRIINNAPFPLHMANLAEKANTFFTSPYFFVTSNARVPDVASLAHKDALYRRFHLYVEVKCRDGYGDKVGQNPSYVRYNKTKAKAHCAAISQTYSPLMTDQYALDIYTVDDEGKSTVTQADLSYDEFWDMYSKEVKSHTDSGTELEKAFHDRAGSSAPFVPLKEREVLKQFAEIYKLETLVDAVAEDDGGFKDAQETTSNNPLDILEPTGQDNDSEEKKKAWWAKIKTWTQQASVKIQNLANALWRVAEKALSIGQGFATLIISVLHSAFGRGVALAQQAKSYLFEHPCISALASCLTAALAYWGYKQFPKRVCDYAQYPTNTGCPCKKCDWCAYVDFPPGISSSHLFDFVVQRARGRDALSTMSEKANVDLELYSSRIFCTVGVAEGKVYSNEVPRKPKVTIAEGGRGTYTFREQVTATMRTNAVRLESISADGRKCSYNGIFLKGRVLITTYHTLCPVDFRVNEIRLRNPLSDRPSVVVPYSALKVTRCTDSEGGALDLAIVTFSGMVPNRRDIVKRFVRADDLPAVTEGELTCVGFHEAQGVLLLRENRTREFDVALRERQYTLHHNGKCPFSLGDCVCSPARVASHISYKLPSGPGFCGSLLAVDDAPIRSCLMGLHVAGGGVAYASVLTQEFLNRNLLAHVSATKTAPDDLIDGALPYAEGLVDCVTVPDLMQSGGDCLAIGVAPAPHCPTKTELRPSLIHGKLLPPITAPARLHKLRIGDQIVDPMKKGIAKVTGTQTFIDPYLIEAALNDVFSMLPRPKRTVLTYEEGICGVEGDPYMRPVNRTTSPGYPYTLNNPGRGKQHWLGSEERYIMDNKELRSDVEKLIEQGRLGIRGSAISTATLKDERRDLEKVAQAKTRVFEACPMHLVIAIRMYFLPFAAVVMRERVECESCVGVNPYSSEWTQMAMDLKLHGDNMVAGDFSNYDGSLTCQILVAICRSINEWCDDGWDNRMIRSTLWEHVVSADVMVRGDVIRQTHSQPSGNPLTVIINSIYNSVIMRVAYMSLKIVNGLPAICDFRRFVKLLAYGDDNVLSVSSAIASWFNQITITEALKKLGMSYTDDQKRIGMETPFRRLSEITFLKRYFRDSEDGWYRGAMPVQNILEMTNWVRGKLIKQRTKENCEFALMELSYHSQQVYDMYSRLLRKECKLVGISLDVPLYSEWQVQRLHEEAFYEKYEYVPLWHVHDPLGVPELMSTTETSETVPPSDEDLSSLMDSVTLAHDSAIAEGEISTATPAEEQATHDELRGQLMTDIQASVDSTPMDSTTTILALNDRTQHEMDTLLTRPVVLGNYKWSTSSAALSYHLTRADYHADTVNYLQKWNFPQDIFAQAPLLVDKLKNFQYFKSDVEIEVKINAQPFLSGALMLVYNPYYDKVSDIRGKGTRFLASQSSCPNKILSLENGNSLKMTCPYANVMDLFDLDDANDQFGTAFLYVLSDLKSSTVPSEVSFTVFARFINPQYYVPTQRSVLNSQIVTQQAENLQRLGWTVTAPVAEGEITSDTGETKKSGPISTIAKTVSQVAGIVSKVPVLGSVATTVDWVARAVGGVASVFGFSKPVRADAHTVQVIKPMMSSVHSEGYDDAITMALLQDNGIDGTSILPSSQDEMALSYIFSRPNFFYRKEVTSFEFRAGELLLKWEVSPFSTYQAGDVENPDSLFLGAFSYASMMGDLWRGTIVFDIYMIKTCFHQGRFAIVHLPETAMDDVPATLGSLLTTNYGKSVNLREAGSESSTGVVRIPVPYISNVPWKRTTLFAGTVPHAGTLATSAGCLAIYALTDLSVPDSVASNMAFLIAHSGGDDYEVARPRTKLIGGYTPPTAYAEGDFGEVAVPDHMDIMIPNVMKTNVTEQTTGEYFKSLRALIKRSSPVAAVKGNLRFINYKPHRFQEGYDGQRILQDKRTSEHALPTPFYLVSFLYRFWNGSTVVRIPGSATDVTIDAKLSIDAYPENLADYDGIPVDGVFHTQQLAVSGAAEYRIPYYQDVRCNVVGAITENPAGAPRIGINLRHTWSAISSYMFESAGDDFNFGFLVGPPPMRSAGIISSFATVPFPAPSTSITLDTSAIENGATTINDDGTPSVDIYPLTSATVLKSGVYKVNGNNFVLWGKNTDSSRYAIPAAKLRLVYNSQNAHYAIRVLDVLSQPQVDSAISWLVDQGSVALSYERSPNTTVV